MRAVLAHGAPQAAMRRLSTGSRRPPGWLGRAWLPWIGSVTVSGSTLMRLGARPVRLDEALREMTEGRWRGAVVYGPRDSRCVVIDRAGGCVLRAKRVRGHMLAAQLG